MADWIKTLSGYPKERISAACDAYLRSGPKRRPTPADVLDRMTSQAKRQVNGIGMGDRSKLSFDRLELLENEILPMAREWLKIPSLAGHARKTLEYWGEVD